MNSTCPLCQGEASNFFQNTQHSFSLCSKCFGIFRDRDQFLSLKDEKKRYLNHISSIEDTGYYEFIRPILDEVANNFEKGSLGLDYGCGHTPVLSKHLINKGFEVFEYDPIFFNNPSILKEPYDFIVSCEVIEHFFDPYREFKQLFNLLTSDGKLICKTHPYNKEIDFASWYYKNDPSHVFIYQNETFEWIREKFKIKNVKINDRVITFSK